MNTLATNLAQDEDSGLSCILSAICQCNGRLRAILVSLSLVVARASRLSATISYLAPHM